MPDRQWVNFWIRMKKNLGLIEVGIFYLLCQLVIWGTLLWRPPILLAAVLIVGICVGSNRYHHDSLEKIGLTAKNFWPALKWGGLAGLPLAFVLLFFAWGKRPQAGWNFWFAVFGYPVWGLAQQYALLGFIANRLEESIPRNAVPWVAAVLFCSVHLPNPLLMGVTFAAGLIFTWIYLSYRNLYAFAVLHAVFGVLLSFATGGVEGWMTVGPGYVERMGRWF